MLELCRCPNIYGPDCIYIYIDHGLWILGLTNLAVCQSFHMFTEQHLLYGKQEAERVLVNVDYSN